MKNKIRGQWKAHGRYLARESAFEKSARAGGFNREREGVDIAGKLESWQDARDQQMWKIILSPEFGDRLDLSRLTRDLINQMEKDLGTRLEWAAAEHYNTEHPHVHVVIRGVRDSGEVLRLSRDYVQQGIRSIAADLCTRQLGYRTELDSAEAERREVTEKRLTSIDKRLLMGAQESTPDHLNIVRGAAQAGLSETARSRTRHEVARLAVLSQMGLAESTGPNSWRLRRDFDEVLRAMQRTADRQRTLAAHGALMSDERLHIEVLDLRQLTSVEGRVLVHGQDEQTGRGYSRDLLAKFVGRQFQLAGELTKAEQDLRALDVDVDNGVAPVQRELEVAAREHLAHEASHREVTEELRASETKMASVEGELRILRETAAKLDEGAAREAVSETEVELNTAAPPSSRDITDEILVELRASVAGAQNEFTNIKDAIHKKSGALQHVGGQVTKGRTEDAQEALRILRENERDLEIDYDAWALLRETLLDAEQEEGVHLGRVLGEPIVQRFSDLTEGRYGKLTLGPDLETGTISIAGDGRSIETLSVGTRDQLSIIFRLTLAEQLRSAVVLDDQLTQSDAQRMIWLRNLLRQTSANIQILVFTCRPADYLSPAELKTAKKPDHFSAAVRLVDLAQMIERSGHGTSAEPTLPRG
jgi:Protein of unknown function (DUF3363)